MTLICGIKGDNNKSVIISDFRLGIENQQYDAGCKFILYDNTLAIFMAGGGVNLLGEIYKRLNKTKPHFNYNSLSFRNFPLIDIILYVFNSSKHYRKMEYFSQFICVYVDSTTNSHKMFKFNLEYLNNQWTVKDFVDDPDFNWEVIGSGSIIKETKYFGSRIDFDLKKAFDNSFKTPDDDLVSVAHLTKVSIISRLDDLERKAKEKNNDPEMRQYLHIYESLGISPELFSYLFDGGNGTLPSYEQENFIIDSNGIRKSRYTLKKGTDSEIVLEDSTNKKINKLYLPDQRNLQYITKQEKFDPSGKENN